MKSIGLNLFPELDSEKFVTVTAKIKKLEWSFYQNMAACSCAMAFAYSRWNMEINDEHRIVALCTLQSTNSFINQVRTN
jgi:cancer susceptibility candidate protein 1